MLLRKVLSAPPPKTMIEDVFLANTRTGTGAAYSVTGGPNLATYGGMVHIKNRDTAGNDHIVYDTVRGVGKLLRTNTTGAEASNLAGYDLTAFNSDGFSLGTPQNSDINTSGKSNVDWIWRNAYNFFQVLSVTKSAGSNRVIDLSPYMAVVGMVKVKRTDSTGSWYVWHRSLTAGKLLIGETTAGETTLGQITVSGTTLTLVDGVIADGTYHIEAYAHDASADGLIQCGSTVSNDAGGGAVVTLGYETQYVLLKIQSGAADSWHIYDTSRGMIVSGSGAVLYPNTPEAETITRTVSPTATGFILSNGWSNGFPIVFVAVRRGPMRFPTSGAQVYNAIARTGTGAAATVTGVGFPPDLNIGKERGSTGAPNFTDRMRGATFELLSSGTAAEAAFANDITAFGMDGVSLGTGASGQKNTNLATYIEYFFRRWPGVFDIIGPKGTGVAHNEPHNLVVAPGLIVWKKRSSGDSWGCYANFGATTYFAALQWGSVAKSDVATYTTSPNGNFGLGGRPTATAIPLDATGAVNASGSDYIGLLFGELLGVSKIGAIAGTGATQVINCNFSAGARFVLAMLTSGSGATNVYLWDSVRGIVAGNDPFLLLNSTAAEDTSTDYIDPHASGFELPAGSPINASGTTAVFFAIA